MSDNYFQGRSVIRTRDHDNVGAPESRSRLAQPPSWEQMPAAERVCCVNQHDFDISRKLKMLKTIVQNEPLDAALRKFAAAHPAILSDAKQNAISQPRP